MMTTPRTLDSTPSSSIDLFDDALLSEPYEAYKELRDLGGVVWMDKLGMFALPRFSTTLEALSNDKVFVSGEGVTLNDTMNANLRGITLCSDDDAHTAMRNVIGAPLTPAAVKRLSDEINEEARTLVDQLMARGRFDAVGDFARHLPVTIVSKLVGLPEDGRERMLEWAQANFNCFGPINARTEEALPIVGEMIRYALEECVPGKLKSDGWAQRIWDAADRGEIRHDQCAGMMNDYMGPSLDTTIAAASNLIVQFADYPEQWETVVAQPNLIPNAINEGVRRDSPILLFSRFVALDTVVEGVSLPKGSRVLVMYAAANRDERQYLEPERFDVRRRAADHLGFGFGAHRCVGNNLARLEISALFRQLVSRVKRFEVDQRTRASNNILRMYAHVDVTVH